MCTHYKYMWNSPAEPFQNVASCACLTASLSPASAHTHSTLSTLCFNSSSSAHTLTIIPTLVRAPWTLTSCWERSSWADYMREGGKLSIHMCSLKVRGCDTICVMYFVTWVQVCANILAIHVTCIVWIGRTRPIQNTHSTKINGTSTSLSSTTVFPWDLLTAGDINCKYSNLIITSVKTFLKKNERE